MPGLILVTWVIKSAFIGDICEYFFRLIQIFMTARKILSLLSICICLSVQAQILFPGHFQEDYYRLLLMKNNLKEPITYRPSLIHMYATDSVLEWDIWDGRLNLKKETGDFIKPIDPFAKLHYSTGDPGSYNDGAVWEGKGMNASINFGFTGRKGKFHFTFAPVLYSTQNRDFYIEPTTFSKSPFSYPFEDRIDYVLRYGDESFTKFHPGQSEIRLIHKKLTFGLSTQSMVWGPAQFTPIIMSNNAGGFPHLDFGTAGPIDTKFGKFEFRTFWGMLDESDYFDDDPTNDERYITGTVVGFQPKFAPELSLGLNRVLYKDMFDGNFKPIDLFASLWTTIENPDRPNDDYDQMMSLTLKWLIKEYGLETYMEWARNDFPGTVVDWFENTDRSRAITMGLSKTFDFDNGALFRFVYEYTILNKVRMSEVDRAGNPSYYVHSVVENGYTNQGQLLGSYTGPGSNANHIRLQYFAKWGQLSLYYDRVRFNDDYFILNDTGDPIFENDHRFRWGLSYLTFLGDFVIDTHFRSDLRKNWYYNDDRSFRQLSLDLRIAYLINRND